MKIVLFISALVVGASSAFCASARSAQDLMGARSTTAVLTAKQGISAILGKATAALERSGRKPGDYMLVHLSVDSSGDGIVWNLLFQRKGDYVQPDTHAAVRIIDSTGDASVRGALAAK